MPSQAHHCNAGGKSGCSGTVVSGQNCPKCEGYSECENACGKFVNVAGKTCPACIAKAAGDAKRAKEAEKKKKKEKREIEARELEELQLAARDPDADFLGESLVARSLDADEMGIYARGLDAHLVDTHFASHGHPPLRPLSLTSDDTAHIAAMPHKSTSGPSGFFFGVAATLTAVMIYGLWRRFMQKRKYLESITRS